jgi:prepilin-type N-terminal cleavage/methylation domain-containing protein/prepilin-type processing-associated H-X9-DG protein
MPRKTPYHAAFTLVELLVVIGIIAVLIGILLPVLSKAREHSNKTACLANLRSLGQAMRLYAGDFRDRLPNTNPPGTSDQAAATIQIDYVMVKLREVHAKANGVFHCPSDKDSVPNQITNATVGFADSARISYDFYSLYWVPEKGPKLTKIKDAPLAWDLKGADPTPNDYQNHGLAKGGNVVFADGHAEWQDAKDWDGWNWPKPATARYQ